MYIYYYIHIRNSLVILICFIDDIPLTLILYKFLVLRLMIVSCETKEEAASSAPMDSRFTHMSILQERELRKSKMP